jgi:hypothetical protein
MIGFAAVYLVRHVPQVPLSQELGKTCPHLRSVSKMETPAGIS